MSEDDNLASDGKKVKIQFHNRFQQLQWITSILMIRSVFIISLYITNILLNIFL